VPSQRAGPRKSRQRAIVGVSLASVRIRRASPFCVEWRRACCSAKSCVLAPLSLPLVCVQPAQPTMLGRALHSARSAAHSLAGKGKLGAGAGGKDVRLACGRPPPATPCAALRQLPPQSATTPERSAAESRQRLLFPANLLRFRAFRSSSYRAAKSSQMRGVPRPRLRCYGLGYYNTPFR
jgi:hypothetical protein